MDRSSDGEGLSACGPRAGRRGCSQAAWSPARASPHPGPAADWVSSGSRTQPPPSWLLGFAGESGGYCHAARCLGWVTERNPPSLSRHRGSPAAFRRPIPSTSCQAALPWLAWVIWKDSSGRLGRLISDSSSQFRPMWWTGLPSTSYRSLRFCPSFSNGCVYWQNGNARAVTPFVLMWGVTVTLEWEHLLAFVGEKQCVEGNRGHFASSSVGYRKLRGWVPSLPQRGGFSSEFPAVGDLRGVLRKPLPVWEDAGEKADIMAPCGSRCSSPGAYHYRWFLWCE